METLEKNIVEITVDGKNVTGDVSPYLSRCTYTDQEEAESDEVTLVFEDTNGQWHGPWYPQQGDSLTAKMGESGNLLDCGLFEIDQIEYEFPPDLFSIKAIGAAITKDLRTKNSKAFEKQSLKKIAQYFADKHKLKLTGDVSELQKIEIERKTQDKQTDIAFLQSLAKEYGLIFSVRGDQLVFMDAATLETQKAVLTFAKTQMSKGRFQDKTAQVYAEAKVATRNMRTNTVQKWSVKPSGTPGKKDTLIVGGRAESDGQAQAKAKGALKNCNKDKITGTFTVPGNNKLVAGINIELTVIGKFSGKWHVVSSTHTVDKSSGYTTDVNVRKIEEK